MRTRNLKRLEVAAALSLAALSAVAFASGQRRDDFGPMRSETRAPSNFERISAGQLFKVVVHLGEKPKVVLHAPAELLRSITTDVRRGALEIRLNEDRRTSINAKMSAEVWVPSLTGVSVAGLASMDIKGLVRESSFDASATGQGVLNLSADVNRFNVEQAGKSVVTLGNLKAKSFNLEGSGAGICRLSGSADRANLGVAGVYQFKGDRFTINRANVQSSGSSLTDIRVKETLDVEASGASLVHYLGKPQVRKSLSGMARVTG